MFEFQRGNWVMPFCVHFRWEKNDLVIAHLR